MNHFFYRAITFFIFISSVAAQAKGTKNEAEAVPGEYLVKFRQNIKGVSDQTLAETLGSYIKSHIPDQNILRLLKEIIESFHSTRKDVGLPLGNLTSQLFANVYLNEFDQFMKHNIKARFYIRYADDFVILSHNKEYLKYVLPCIEEFLIHNLQLALHPDKVSITAVASGVDFLGWVHFPDHRVVRMATKRRMFATIQRNDWDSAAVQAYLGLLHHGNAKKLEIKIICNKNIFSKK
jgi:hypothetical protein